MGLISKVVYNGVIVGLQGFRTRGPYFTPSPRCSQLNRTEPLTSTPELPFKTP